MPQKKASPTRFVLSLIDTKNTFDTGDKESYMNWNIGFDKFSQLYEEIPEEDGGTEIRRWLNFCEEQTSKMKKRSKTKGYTVTTKEKE